MLFAAGLVLERAPLAWRDLPVEMRAWAQTVGAIAAIGLLLWGVSWIVQCQNRKVSPMPRTTTGWIFLTFMTLSGILFLFLGAIVGGRSIRFFAGMVPSGEGFDERGIRAAPTLGDWIFALAGLLAFLAVATPVLLDLVLKMRWGRIWALSRLSIKEAIRSRVVLIFGLIALVFLFADWFVPYNKPDDQLRNYVAVIYWSLPPLFLVTASLLGAFSIPADIRSQSIHTIVTKPVEKFEIVLGRFIGYSILMTVGLALVGGLSLIYIVRGIHPDAQRESFKARVPIYGRLGFEGTRGESVGRVWDYRRYIGGRNARETGGRDQYAHWSFANLPADLGTRQEPVRFEFTFDIYRMTKGKENQGVLCNFLFIDGRLDRDGMAQRMTEFRESRRKYHGMVESLRSKNVPAGEMLQRIQDQVQIDNPQQGALAVKSFEEYRRQIGDASPTTVKEVSLRVENLITVLHGVFEPPTIEVKDYHTQNQDVPAYLFLSLNNAESTNPRKADSQGNYDPMLRVWVNVDSTDNNSYTNAPQMLGVAPADLYLLAAEKPFWQNFIKGIVGQWFTFLLILGIAVPLSTYLSGVITWLCAMFLFGAGTVRDFVDRLARGQHEGGGPMQSIYRIFTQTFHSGQLDESPTTTTLRDVDAVYQFIFRLVHSILPDVNRFNLQEYVANGFDIAWGQILLLNCLLPFLGYVVPWLILGYYLIKSREIANPN